MLVEATELTRDRAAEVFGPLMRGTEEIAGTFGDAELAAIRDFLRRWHEAIAAHGDALARRATSAGPAPRPPEAPAP